MSVFSLTLVLQIKTSKIINDMAKVQIKSEKITAFGGIFFVLDKFDSILSSVIDSHLGLRNIHGVLSLSQHDNKRTAFPLLCFCHNTLLFLSLFLYWPSFLTGKVK